MEVCLALELIYESIGLTLSAPIPVILGGLSKGQPWALREQPVEARLCRQVVASSSGGKSYASGGNKTAGVSRAFCWPHHVHCCCADVQGRQSLPAHVGFPRQGAGLKTDRGLSYTWLPSQALLFPWLHRRWDTLVRALSDCAASPLPPSQCPRLCSGASHVSVCMGKNQSRHTRKCQQERILEIQSSHGMSTGTWQPFTFPPSPIFHLHVLLRTTTQH